MRQELFGGDRAPRPRPDGLPTGSETWLACIWSSDLLSASMMQSDG